MKRKHHAHHEYMGRIIWRNDEPGHRLRWSSLGVGSSNTLAGMKRLIKDKTQKL